MNSYIYPAIFHQNPDETYTITYPDLPGCISEGKNLADAMKMAQSALSQWIDYLNDTNEAVPEPSAPCSLNLDANEFISLINVDLRDNHAVKRTVSIPRWMDEQASDAGLSLSKVLQDALKRKIGIL